MAEWPLHLFLHHFLLFSLSHSSHQVTINAGQLILTLLQPISFLQHSLAEWPLLVSFLLSSACPTHFGSLLIKKSNTLWLTFLQLLKKHVGRTHGTVHPTKTHFLIRFNQRISRILFQILVLRAHHRIPLSTFLSHPSAEIVGIKTK